MSYMSIGVDVGVALQLICQGNHFASECNIEAAEKAYLDAGEIYKNILVKCPGIEYEKELYRTYKKLGTLYHTAGNFDKAVHTYKEIIEHLERLISFDINADSYKLKIASTSLICISILESSEEKKLLLEKAIKFLEEVNCDNTLLAISYKTKGDLLAQEDSEKCREAYLKALCIAENEKNDEICEEVAEEIKGLIRMLTK